MCWGSLFGSFLIILRGDDLLFGRDSLALVELILKLLGGLVIGGPPVEADDCFWDIVLVFSHQLNIFLLDFFLEVLLVLGVAVDPGAFPVFTSGYLYLPLVVYGSVVVSIDFVLLLDSEYGL